MATTSPQRAAVHPRANARARQPAQRQGAALRELAVARPYGFVQAKLTVGPANDRFEQEADAVADRVMRMEDSRPPGDSGNDGCPRCQSGSAVNGNIGAAAGPLL